MRPKPILFNQAMVHALLNGTKSVTRRVVKPQPEKSAYGPYECVGGRIAFRVGEHGCTDQYRPPYRPGDILYVRETWQYGFSGTFLYKASAGLDLFITADGDLVSDIPWRPSIHMPREAARIFLRVTDVRIERLWDITEEQAVAEGLYMGWTATKRSSMASTARQAFMWTWDITIKSCDRALYGWIANPWVWVIEFERISKEAAYA